MRELFDYPGDHRNEAGAMLEILDLAGRDEPDCSPHPFDVMAIEALYQTVKP